MKMRKVLALILSFCIAASLLAGCNNDTGSSPTTSGSPSAAGSSDGGTSPDSAAPGTYLRDKLTMSAYSDGGSLDPFVRSAWGNLLLLELIYQHLATIDSDGHLYMEVAKSFDQVDDTHYTLTIWDNIVDTMGNPITADDVMWCFEQYVAAGNQGGVNKFDHFEKVDDHTLTWVLPSPFTAGELEKNLSNCPILSQASYEACNNDMTANPVGSGPYKLKSYTPGSTVVLEANEDFWMRDLDGFTPSKWQMQNVKEIEYQIIQDASSRAVALEMGNIDIADDLDAADVEAFASNPDIAPVLMPQDAPVAFIFNCSGSSPFADVNLRKAVCYGLDNDAIAEALAVPAYPVYGVAPRMWDAPDSWLDGRDYYNFDAAQAKSLVDGSSYNKETVILQYTSSTSNDGAAIMIQSQLREIGINVELRALEESVRQIEMYEEDEWDFRMETMGGGNYLTQVLKRFSSADASAHLDGGRTIMMIPDQQLDALWDAMVADTSEETVNAWDDYFTYDQCYVYAICCYANQTCSRSDVNAVTAGTRNLIAPNASTFN